MIDLKKAKSLPFAPLALIDWMMESPSTRFIIRDQDWRGHETHVYEIREGEAVRIASSIYNKGDPDFIDRLGGKVGFDLESIRLSKVLTASRADATPGSAGEKNGYTKFMEAIGATVPNPGYNLLYRAGSHTKTWWEEAGKVRFLSLKKKREEERAQVNRIIVIGAKCTLNPVVDDEVRKLLPPDFKLPVPSIRIMRPTYTATVVKESDTRIYVRNVERIRPAGSYDGREEIVIKGREPNRYIEREHLMADGVSTATPRHIIEADAEREADYHEACRSALAATLEPLLSLHNRLFQAKSMHADLMQEAIEKDRKN